MKKVKEQDSDMLASQMISNLKSNYHKLWVVTIILLIMFGAVTCYLVYVLNDTGVIETTTDSSYDVSQDSGEYGTNNFVNGDDNEVING